MLQDRNQDRHPPKVGVWLYDEPDIDLGSLEREAFGYMREWAPKLNEQGYGLAVRLAIKAKVIYEGESVNLALFFGIPIARPGIIQTQEMADENYRQLANMVIEGAELVDARNDTVVLGHTNPPDWMLRDLEETLKHYNQDKT